MDFASRLWRVLRGRSDFGTVDPDELLQEVPYERPSAQHRWSDQASQPPPPPPPPPPDELTRAYARLEIPLGTPLPEVKKAWRRLMRTYHPDRFGQDQRKQELATRVAAALTEAYYLIRDRES